MQGKRSIRLIAFDLDGTVLDDHKKILPQTKAALESAAGRGIEIVPATGRPYCGLSSEIDRLQGVRYVLTCNGAGVYEKETGKCRMESGMSLNSFLPLLAEVEPLVELPPGAGPLGLAPQPVREMMRAAAVAAMMRFFFFIFLISFRVDLSC